MGKGKKPRKRNASSRPINQRVATLSAQGEVSDSECNHSHCKPVRATITTLALGNYAKFGITAKQIRATLAHMPKLLCGMGAWPPQNVNARASQFVYGIFVEACRQHNAAGLRGQQYPAYPGIYAQMVAAAETAGLQEKSPE
jgi:hypothetical protein